jgi:hypothetical protein
MSSAVLEYGPNAAQTSGLIARSTIYEDELIGATRRNLATNTAAPI